MIGKKSGFCVGDEEELKKWQSKGKRGCLKQTENVSDEGEPKKWQSKG
jgi:hypothetical protein